MCQITYLIKNINRKEGRKFMKKRLAILLSLTMLTSTFVPQTVLAEDEEVVLSIMSCLQTEDEAELEQAIADAYMEENPNVKIEFISVANNDLDAQVTTMAASDDLPDAFFMNCAFMSTALDMGIVVDANDYISDDFKADIPQEVLDYATVDDTLMFIPWFQIPIALIYRTDWLEQAGMDTIETMDDFKNAAKEFTEISGNYGFSMVGARNGSGEARFSVYAKAFGVDEVYQNDAGQWETDLTSDNFKTALQSFVDLDLVEGTVPAGASETEYQDAVTYFANEQTGLNISGSNAVGAILNRNPELAGKIGSVPIPAGTNEEGRHVTNLQVSGYTMTTACEHPEIMADYLEFMANYENPVSFGTASGRIPITNSALADEAFSGPEYTGFRDCMQYSIPYSTFPAYAEVQDIFGEAYNSMLTGVSIDDAISNVDTRMSELLAEYNG